MARLRRLVVPGQVHYVMQRGHNGQAVFIDADDRRQYLAALREALHAHGVALHAYALLDDQVQLLLTPPTEAAMSRTMQALGRRYGAQFNNRHGRRGTLWDGRFRAAVVQPGALTLQCLGLIDGLPGRNGLDDAAAGHPRSSAPHRLGLRRDPLITDPPEFWGLGNTPFEREAAYASLLERGLDDASAQRIEHAARNGWALGSADFLAAMAQALDRPVRPRARGRPPRRAV